MSETRAICILLVEDDTLDRMAVERTFEKEDLPYDLVFAETVAAALARLGEGDIDLVLIDQGLPDGTGLELQEQLDEIPCIFLTGADDVSIAVQALKAGAYDYLVKDTALDFLQLIPVTIENALKKKRDEEELARYRLQLEEEVQLRTIELQETNEQLQNEIIERALADGALQAEVRRSAQVLSTMLDGFILADTEGQLIDVNQAYCALVGYSKAELLKMNIRDLAITTTSEEAGSQNEQMLSQGEPRFEIRHRHKDGHRIDLDVSVVILSPDDAPLVASFVHDVTERKKAEKALRESEMKFRRLTQTSPDAIITSDRYGKVVSWNAAAEKMFGIREKEIAGKPFIRLMPERYRESHNKVMRRLLLTGESRVPGQTADGHGLRKEGKEFPIELSISSWKIDEEIYYGAIVRDITARKEAEDTLRESERVLLESQELAQIGSYSLDILSGIWKSSKVLDKVFGIDEDFERSTDAWVSLVHPEWQQLMAGYFAQDVLEERGRFDKEYKIIRVNDQTERWVHGIGELEMDVDGNPVRMIGTIQDVTERVRAEEQLKLQSAALESAANAIVITDRDGDILWVNPAFSLLTGYSEEEVIGQNPRVLKSGAHDSAYYKKLWDTILSRKVWHGEIINQRKDGELYTEEMTIAPLLSKGGEVTNFIAIKQDITERKRAENELSRLYRASESLLSGGTPNIQSLAQTIVETMLKEFGPSNCSLFLVNQERDGLNRAALAGPYTEELVRSPLELGGQGLIPKAIRTGRLINVPNVLDDSSFVRNWEAARSELAIPLKVGQQIIGVIDVQSAEMSAFNADDERLMTIFAEKAGLALENVKLLDQSRRRAEEMAALLKISRAMATLEVKEVLETIAGQAKILFAADGSRIHLLQPDGETLRCVVALHEGAEEIMAVPLKMGEGITGSVAQNGEPEIVNAVLSDPRSIRIPGTPDEAEVLALTPLKVRGKVTGVMTVGRLGEERPFLPENLSLITAFGEQASIALENARLHEQTELRLQRISALRDIDLTISSSMGLDFTLKILLDNVISQLGVDAACILIFNPSTRHLKDKISTGFKTDIIKQSSVRLEAGDTERLIRRGYTNRVADSPNTDLPFGRNGLVAAEGFVVYIAVPLISKGEVKGILEIFNRTELVTDMEWKEFLGMLARQTSIAIENTTLFEDLQRSNFELKLAYEDTIEAWARVLDLRDKEIEGHSRRVMQMALRLANATGLRQDELVNLRRGALLHDIGKMSIPDSILHKPGPLKEDEWEIMCQHPSKAKEMLSKIHFLDQAIDIPYCHHEKWDGTGYPRGLSGEQIPLAARIFAVVDVWDALRSDRQYREKWPEEKARRYIQKQMGKHFDPRIAEAFLSMLDEGLIEG